MNVDKMPTTLSEKRRDQWQNALLILNEVVDAEGFHTATLEAVETGTLYQMSVERREDGSIVVDGPEKDVAVKEMDGWFGCQIELKLDGIGLSQLQGWMSAWINADLAFLPQMLLDDSENCRSHQARDHIEFTFIWKP